MSKEWFIENRELSLLLLLFSAKDIYLNSRYRKETKAAK